MTKKKPEQIPIEEAIGERAKDPKAAEKFKAEYETAPIPSTPQTPLKPDEPTPSEMLTLEELNHETVERLQDQYPEEEEPQMVIESGKPVEIKTTPMQTREPTTKNVKLITPVSKPVSQPVTKTCSPESPPQKKVEKPWVRIGADTKLAGETPLQMTIGSVMDARKQETPQEIDKIDEYQDAEKHETPQEITVPNSVILNGSPVVFPPAEDKELTALKKYIMGSGFVATGVAYHIVALCSQPMTTPCTTTWDFKDRAMVPEMVFTLLRQPGYLEGVWPSLKVVMSSNIGNDSWCAGICTTIAFFDVIRTLPAVKELAQQK